jgi:hypothetical protein
VVQIEGLQCREGVHFLGLCRLRGMRFYWLELIWNQQSMKNIVFRAREKWCRPRKKNERLLVGIVAIMMNCEIILHELG